MRNLGFRLPPVDAYPPGFDQSLDGTPAQVGQLVRDVPIQTRTEIVTSGTEFYQLTAFLFGACVNRVLAHQSI